MHFKVRLMRTVSFEADLDIEAATEVAAKRQALEKANIVLHFQKPPKIKV